MNVKKRFVCLTCNVLAIVCLITSVFLLFTTYGGSLKGAIQKQQYVESTEVKDEITSQLENLMDNILVMQFIWEDQNLNQYRNENIMEFITESGEVKWLSIKDMISIGMGTSGIGILYDGGLVNEEINCYINCINWIYGPIYVEKEVPLFSVMKILGEMYRIYVNAEMALEQAERKPSNLKYYIQYKEDIYTNAESYWQPIVSQPKQYLEDVIQEGALQEDREDMISCYICDKTYMMSLEIEGIYHAMRDYMSEPAFSKLNFIEEFLKEEGIIEPYSSLRTYVHGQLDWTLLEFWRNAAVGFAFDTGLHEQDSFITFDSQYVLCKQWAMALLVSSIISFLVWIVTLVVMVGNNQKYGQVLRKKIEKKQISLEDVSLIDSVAAELAWGGAVAIGVISFFVMQIPIDYVVEYHFALIDVGDIFGYYKMDGFWLFFLYLFLVILWYVMGLRLLKRMQIRNELQIRFRKTSLTIYFFHFLKSVYDNRNVTVQTALALAVFVICNWGNVVYLHREEGIKQYLFWGTSIVIHGVLIYILLKRSIGQKKISDTIWQMTKGDVGVKVDTTDMKGNILQMAQAVNYLGNGLEKALEEATMNERMKTELLTNVSHDIKTPLTSIVNYVDLLKMTDLPDTRAKEYLNILEEKSIRLKQLTEDLVEAARANSGTLSLEMVQLDLVEFMQQVVGEFSDKFQEKKLDLVVSMPESSIFIEADGNRLWRVFENLMNNACKYSMSGTRVFMDCIWKEQEVCIAFKNISDIPLNIRGEELTERFVRGDESRTTEGSGLGLSIARGFVERMGGTLEIQVEGDMFKAIICFPTL